MKSKHPSVTSVFVEEARKIPEVQTILLEGDATEETRIWTVISAPPFEASYRRRVYAAQYEALQQGGEPVVDFRLINIQEFTGDLDTVLPAQVRCLFQRKSA